MEGLLGIVAALAGGAALSLGGIIAVKRWNRIPLDGARLAKAVGIVIAVNAAAVVLSIVFRPDGGPRPAEMLLNVVGAVVLPGVLLCGAIMMLLPPSFHGASQLIFGGYALNAALWFLFAYWLVGWRRQARA